MLDDRPDAPPPTTPESAPKRASSPTATWNFASRLARREVQRRPGRTLLVMMLVAIPVMGMAAASILARTVADFSSDRFTREYGSGDLVLISPAGPQPDGEPLDPLVSNAQALPPGSMTSRYIQVFTGITAEVDGENRRTFVAFSDIDLTDPMNEARVLITEGRAPSGIDEMLLAAPVAERLGIRIGDDVRFMRPDLDVTIVGIGRDADFFDEPLAIVGGEFDRTLLRTQSGQHFTVIDLPGTPSASEIDALRERFAGQNIGTFDRVSQAAYSDDEVPAHALAWGWIAGVVAFVAVGIVIAAAFATSARRQLVTIGQLSANGAPERLVRRTMGLQGAWTGLLGAIAGIGLALLAVLVVTRTGWHDELANRDMGPFDIRPLDLLVIAITAVVAATGAALVPARSASRIPVLTALSGRRPVGTPPSWLAPTGVALLAGGLLLLFGAASSNDSGNFIAAMAVAGSLAVLFGMVCASPLIVAGIGAVGSRFGGVVRLASRSLDRGRARSAAVLTAVATVGALAIAGATTAGLAERQQQSDAFPGAYVRDLARVDVRFSGDLPYFAEQDAGRGDAVIFDAPPIIPGELPTSIRDGLDRIVPDAVVTPYSSVIIDPPPIDQRTGFPVEPFNEGLADYIFVTEVVVATEAVLDRIELSDERTAALEEDGYLALGGYFGDRARMFTEQGVFDLVVRPELLRTVDDGVAGVPEHAARDANITAADGTYIGSALVTEAFVEANGLDTGVSRLVLDNPSDLTGEQRGALQRLSSQQQPDAFVVAASAPGFEAPVLGESWYVSVDYPNSSAPWGLIQLGVGLASLLLVLLVVAIGLSLAATESRDERDVLHAVGASPRTLRRVAAAKAWVITTGAAVVSIPVGYGTMVVIAGATSYTAPFPWALALALLVAVPAVAAAATWLTSSIAQRVRPISYSVTSAA